MKWVLQAASSAVHYWSLEAAASPLSLRYNLESKAVRLQHEEKRLFFLEWKGWFHQKIVVKSEYGAGVAIMVLPKIRDMGVISLDRETFYFDGSNSALKLFDSHKQLLAQSDIDPYEYLSAPELAALVFSLTWIIPSVHGRKALTNK